MSSSEIKVHTLVFHAGYSLDIGFFFLQMSCKLALLGMDRHLPSSGGGTRVKSGVVHSLTPRKGRTEKIKRGGGANIEKNIIFF